jgi:hypothetical protein
MTVLPKKRQPFGFNFEHTRTRRWLRQRCDAMFREAKTMRKIKTEDNPVLSAIKQRLREMRDSDYG